MKFFFKLCLLSGLIIASLGVQAQQTVWMKPANVKTIQVTSNATNATYTLQTEGTWEPGTGYTDEAANCPTPTYATILSTQPGADAMLSIALTAKTTDISVTLVGVCGYHQAYFEIQRIMLRQN